MPEVTRARWLRGCAAALVLLLAPLVACCRWAWSETQERLAFACARLGLPRSALPRSDGGLQGTYAVRGLPAQIDVRTTPWQPCLAYFFIDDSRWSRELVGPTEIDAARANEIAARAAERYLGVPAGEVQVVSAKSRGGGGYWEAQLRFGRTPADWIPRHATVSLGRFGRLFRISAFEPRRTAGQVVLGGATDGDEMTTSATPPSSAEILANLARVQTIQIRMYVSEQYWSSSATSPQDLPVVGRLGGAGGAAGLDRALALLARGVHEQSPRRYYAAVPWLWVALCLPDGTAYWVQFDPYQGHLQFVSQDSASAPGPSTTVQGPVILPVNWPTMAAGMELRELLLGALEPNARRLLEKHLADVAARDPRRQPRRARPVVVVAVAAGLLLAGVALVWRRRRARHPQSAP